MIDRGDIPVVCLTGGPCSGKTSAPTILRQRLGDYGVKAFVVSEVPTEFITDGFDPQSGNLDGRVFQENVFRHVLERENRWIELAKAFRAPKKVVICDRGALDGLPYAGRENFEKMAARIGTTVSELRDKRYDCVIHMRTTALGAEEFYTLENNPARHETIEQARVRDQQTLDAWTGHQHLRIVDNSTDFREKVNRVLKWICIALEIPVPIEVERRFLVEKPVFKIPMHHEVVEITQDYIESGDPAVQERVRQRSQHGHPVFYQARKRDIRPGVRTEREWLITPDQYIAALRRRKRGFGPVMKNRACFVHDNQYLELDTFFGRHIGRQILEVELTEENDTVEIPSFLGAVREITGDRHYSNYELARLK